MIAYGDLLGSVAINCRGMLLLLAERAGLGSAVILHGWATSRKHHRDSDKTPPAGYGGGTRSIGGGSS